MPAGNKVAPSGKIGILKVCIIFKQEPTASITAIVPEIDAKLATL
jgi:hypothetical protein